MKPLTESASNLNSMNRRAFFRISSGFGLSALLTACGVADDSKEISDESELESTSSEAQAKLIRTNTLPAASQAYSVLKRTSFGVNRYALSEIQTIGVQSYLERQIAYEGMDDGPLNAAIASRFPTVVMPISQTFSLFPANQTTLIRDFASATLFRAFFSKQQLYEVMVEFWGNHFAIDLRNGVEPVLKPIDDRNVIRPNAMASFRKLLIASARSPAMLFSLDNFMNTQNVPNENYARELMELHTLGVDGGYTEKDIKEVARCFSGWSINQTTGDYEFLPSAHDTGQKIVLGQVIPAGGQEQDGLTVLNMLAGSSATANHIAKKLCRRFISDNPPSAVVAQVAQTFRDTDGDIRSMLRTIFKSSAFLDARDGKIDRPIEFVAQIVRALNPQLTIPGDKGEGYLDAMNLLGQMPYHWAPPDGYPDIADYWANTSGFLNRWRLALVAGSAGLFNLNALIGAANTINTVVDALSNSVLQRPMRPSDRQSLVSWVSGQLKMAPTTIMPASTASAILSPLVSMLISSAYFQMR